MALIFRTRTVSVNQVIFDQADIFLTDQFTRAAGVLITDVTLSLLFNNATVNWPLVPGASILDTQVASGSVYWNNLPNSVYGLRFLPNSLGHWTLSIRDPGHSQLVCLSYDVIRAPSVDSGLIAGFCTG